MKDDKIGDAVGTLYVVATPIGNLEDITFRAVRILKEVDLIASEDTRHSRKLLTHYGIAKPLVSYFKEREAARSEQLIASLKDGKDIALISDAGTPAISDPGYRLVHNCYASRIPVVPVPGPSSLSAAVSVSGFSGSVFTFIGFLPAKQGQRRKLLKRYVNQQEPLIFFESPRRLTRSLADCLEIMGNRQVFLARELTKIHEELFPGSLADLIEFLAARHQIKGECVVMLSGNEQDHSLATDDLDELLCWYRDNSPMKLKEVVKAISVDLGLSRSHVYREALQVWQRKVE